MDARPWVLTCDPGVDDAIALAVAAGSGTCDVRAVVAGAGNVSAAVAWRNATGLAALFGVTAPVAIGSGATVDGTPIQRQGRVHGGDGLAGLAHRLPAPAGPPVDGLPLVRESVVATGPLTDVALALRARRTIERVVWMGGSFPAAGRWRGSVTPGAEFNASADPVAVDEVLTSPCDLALVPIEVTRQVVLAPGDLARWASGRSAARFCAELASRHVGTGPGSAAGGAPGPAGTSPPPAPAVQGVTLHDPVAVVAALDPALFRWQARRLRCSRGGGPPAGALVAVDGPPNVRIAIAADAAAVRTRIVETVLAPQLG